MLACSYSAMWMQRCQGGAGQQQQHPERFFWTVESRRAGSTPGGRCRTCGDCAP